MRNWKIFPAILGATALLAIGLYVAFYFVFLDFFVDLWWFRSLDFESYFWLRWLYGFVFSVVVTVFFFAVFILHFFIASRYLGLNPPDEVLMDSKKKAKFSALCRCVYEWLGHSLHTRFIDIGNFDCDTVLFAMGTSIIIFLW